MYLNPDFIVADVKYVGRRSQCIFVSCRVRAVSGALDHQGAAGVLASAYH